MMNHQILSGKRILVVDDEIDILDSVAETLDMCLVEKAGSHKEAIALFKRKAFDAAILDIMGVDGYDLLKIARQKQIPALMLTAHALSPSHLHKSISEGAYAYIPKDRIADLADYLVDIIEAGRRASRPTGKWFKQLEPLFDHRFGKNWKSRDLQDELQRMFIFSPEELQKIL